MIVKTPKGYEVRGESGKPLGTYATLAEAKKRLAQVEFFKHQDKQKAR